MSSRAAVVTGAVVAVLALAACAGGGGDTADATKGGIATTVRISNVTPPSAANYHAWLAQDLGFFKEEGIEAKFLDVSGDQLSPLIGGQSDIAIVGLNGISALAQKQDVQYIAAYPGHSPFSIVVPKDSPLAKHAHNYQALFDAMVGTTLASSVPGAYTDNIARYLVTNSGHTLKEIPVAPSGTGAAEVAGLQTGALKAALLASPLFEPLIASGKFVQVLDLWKPNEVPGFDLPVATPMVSAKWAKTHPQAIAAFQRAVAKANTWAKDPANFDQMATLIAKHIKGVQASSLAAPLKTFQASLRDSTEYTEADWTLAVKVMKLNNILKKDQDYPYSKGVIPAAK